MGDAQKKTSFYPALDIVLLREIVANPPYGEEKAFELNRWAAIHKNLSKYLAQNGKTVSLRQCRERAEKLIKLYRNSEME